MSRAPRAAGPVIAALAVTALCAAPAGGVGAVNLQTDAPCYLPGELVRISGAGFTAGASYTVTLDRKALGSGKVKPDGSLAGTLSSGKLSSGQRLVRHRLQAYDGLLQGRVAFDVTAFRASFQPAAGDPRTLIVRYSVLGIGVRGSPGAVVYVHYVDPTGRLHGTLPIGRTSGPCGSLLYSKAHRLFPFMARVGTWQLQFDLDPGYSPHRRPRIVRAVTIN